MIIFWPLSLHLKTQCSWISLGTFSFFPWCMFQNRKRHTVIVIMFCLLLQVPSLTNDIFPLSCGKPPRTLILKEIHLILLLVLVGVMLPIKSLPQVSIHLVQLVVSWNLQMTTYHWDWTWLCACPDYLCMYGTENLVIDSTVSELHYFLLLVSVSVACPALFFWIWLQIFDSLAETL